MPERDEQQDPLAEFLSEVVPAKSKGARKAAKGPPPRPERAERPARPAKAPKAPRPDVQHIGEGPSAPTHPVCRMCGDHRRVKEIAKERTSGKAIVLCPTCVKQVEWDRGRRCIACGTYAKRDVLNAGGVCHSCESSGWEALQTAIDLIQMKWIGGRPQV